MANRSIICTAVLVLTLLAMIPGVLAQSQSCDRANAASDSVSGIRTDRVTPKQLRIWGEIEQIAQAVDRAGRPLHPRLHGLWQRAQSSGHTIFIEMMERRAPTRIAGTTTLQKMDSDGNRQVIVIWLHLWAIDNAFVDAAVRRSDGLVPFYRLGQNERYAEVVGHELAHAVQMLENPEYAHLCLKLDVQAAEYLLSRRQSASGAVADEVTRLRQARLQSLTDKIEKPAQAAELEVWRELLNGQRKGARTAAGHRAETTAAR
jgi:hypothetical protein